MTSINRDKIVAEELIRSYVRKRISSQLRKRTLAENKIRQAVRKLLTETVAETDEAPAKSTGINVLADLLEKIVPIIEDRLTTNIYRAISLKQSPLESAKQNAFPKR